MKFDELLEIDELEDILKFRISQSNIPLYLYTRYFILQTKINNEFELSNPHISPKKSLIQIFKYLFISVSKNLFFSSNKDICIFSSGIVNKFENSQYKNRLYSDFYNLFFNQTQLIENSSKKEYLLPKKEKVYYRDFIELLSSFVGKFRKISNQDKLSISQFIQYLSKINNEFITNSMLEQIEQDLVHIVKRHHVQIFLYKLFFKIKKIKLLIVEDAHYGLQSHIFYVANSLEIKTAEFQHGYVSKSHPAYNYSKKIYDQINQYLPNYFLTHGVYWSNECRTPSKKIEIGFPDLVKNYTEYESQYEKEKKVIFISGGASVNRLNQIIEENVLILQSFGYKVYVRPHPSERSISDERYGHLKKYNVKIDLNDLYKSLSEAEFLIGVEHSTVYFEAILFLKKIYILKSEYTEFFHFDAVFISFNNSSELIKLINNNKEIKHNSDYFWDNNWKQNYINFIENTIGIKK